MNAKTLYALVNHLQIQQFVLEMVNVVRQILANVKQVSLEINASHLFALENHQLIQQFALEMDNVHHQILVNVNQDFQEINAK